MTQPGPGEAAKEASASVVAEHAAMLKALPFSDTSDFDDASRGFLGTLEHARIASAQGRVVWSLEPYGFLSDQQAPPTVNPSLCSRASTCITGFSRWSPASIRCAGSTSPT